MQHNHPSLRAPVFVIALAAASSIVACMEQPPPTGLEPPDLEAPSASLELLPALPSALVALEDVLGRVLVGMPPDPAVDELRAALSALATVLQANDGCRLTRSRDAADAALQHVRARAPAELAADLTVVELALGSVQPGEASGCER
jgi:hypothetical protein